MARCPQCGRWVWHGPGIYEEHVCPGCGTVLTQKDSLSGFLLGSLEVVGPSRDSYLEDDSEPVLSKSNTTMRFMPKVFLRREYVEDK